MKWLNPNHRFSSLECEWREKVMTLADAFMRSPFFLLFCIFFSVYSIAAINGYVSSLLHLLNRRTRQIQNGTTWPIGSFHGRQLPTLWDNGPLLLLFEFLCQSYLPRTNEWMKVLSNKYQGNDNNNKNNRALRVRCAFKYLLGFLLLSFPFCQKEATTMLFFSL